MKKGIILLLAALGMGFGAEAKMKNVSSIEMIQLSDGKLINRVVRDESSRVSGSSDVDYIEAWRGVHIGFHEPEGKDLTYQQLIELALLGAEYCRGFETHVLEAEYAEDYPDIRNRVLSMDSKIPLTTVNSFSPSYLGMRCHVNSKVRYE